MGNDTRHRTPVFQNHSRIPAVGPLNGAPTPTRVHDAHHRGQICMLSRQLGHRLPNQVGFGMWEWNKRRQEAGAKV